MTSGFPHKGSVIHQAFPYHDIIILPYVCSLPLPYMLISLQDHITFLGVCWLHGRTDVNTGCVCVITHSNRYSLSYFGGPNCYLPKNASAPIWCTGTFWQITVWYYPSGVLACKLWWHNIELLCRLLDIQCEGNPVVIWHWSDANVMYWY